ncbi:MAG: rRNA (cytosine967-C5)-methyltransferase [Actinomycetota bacterium]|jgi:16S rRNA (cytosine967-C5)-methyltransferase|nr:rRNA (cytosine967-C5)-methyltransferase [Actinomycetota bacterium]
MSDESGESGRPDQPGEPRRDAAGRQRPERKHGNLERSVTRPADRSRSTDPARLAAYTVLRAVAAGAYANLELPKELRDKGIRGRDAAFATELTYGATRLRGLYDPIIASAAGRAVAQIDDNVLDTLRLGAHQLLGMRVASHAAVDQTVGLARLVNGASAAGFVNAVMRRISEKDLDTWSAQVVPDNDPISALATLHSHPEWIVRALRAALIGHGTSSVETLDADLEALLVSDNAAAKVSLVARPGLCEVEELTRAGAAPSSLSRVGAVLDSGDPGLISAVRSGRAAVQDEGSQLVALAVAAAQISTGEESEKWLDLCAGPGGKAALLATLGAQRGATIFANEISEHRTDLVRQTLDAAVDSGIEVMIGTGDGREIGEDEPQTYDRVLVDAPCTGLGALRRRPEARWRRTAADLVELSSLQRALLLSAIDAARSGGIIGYATCSPHLAETRFVVSDVAKKRKDVEIVDARELFQDTDGRQVEHLGEGPFVQLWPHIHGTDAMFFALLRKK